MKRQLVSDRPERKTAFWGRLRSVHRWFAVDIWDPANEPRSLTLRFHRKLMRIGYLAVHGFGADRCVFRASALTYVTVLSLVPLLALAFSVAKGVGAYETLRTEVVDPFLDENLGLAAVTPTAPPAEPGAVSGDPAGLDPDAPPEAMAELRRTLDDGLTVVEQTDFKALGITGLLILLYAVIKMLGTVEGSLNDIWGVQRARTFVRKVSDYTTMVVVTPVLILIALTLTTAAQDNSLVTEVRDFLHLGPVFDLLLRFTPLFAVWIGFGFLYLAFPNTRTSVVSSLIGGIVGGTLWQLAQIGHVKFQLGMASHSAVYASFAAVPIFLVWVQISWITVLAGAEVAYAHQNEPAYRATHRATPTDHAYRELLALRVCVRVGAAFIQGAKPWTGAALAEALDVPGRQLEEVLGPLVEGAVLAESGERPELAYLPARDLEVLCAVDVLDALKGKVGPVEVPGNDLLDHGVAQLLGDLDLELGRSPANRSIGALARAALRRDEAVSGADVRAAVPAVEGP